VVGIAGPSHTTNQPSTRPTKLKIEGVREGNRDPGQLSGKVTERGPHGYDGAKRLDGRKRHPLVDTLGLPAVHVTGADVSDRDRAVTLLRRLDRRQVPRLRQDHEFCRPPPRRSFHLAVFQLLVADWRAADLLSGAL
jgi:hypothetical protein